MCAAHGGGPQLLARALSIWANSLQRSAQARGLEFSSRPHYRVLLGCIQELTPQAGQEAPGVACLAVIAQALLDVQPLRVPSFHLRMAGAGVPQVCSRHSLLFNLFLACAWRRKSAAIYSWFLAGALNRQCDGATALAGSTACIVDSAELCSNCNADEAATLRAGMHGMLTVWCAGQEHDAQAAHGGWHSDLGTLSTAYRGPAALPRAVPAGDAPHRRHPHALQGVIGVLCCTTHSTLLIRTSMLGALRAMHCRLTTAGFSTMQCSMPGATAACWPAVLQHIGLP